MNHARHSFESAQGYVLMVFSISLVFTEIALFISNFNNLGLLFLLVNLAKNLSVLFIFSKNRPFHQFFCVFVLRGFLLIFLVFFFPLIINPDFGSLPDF